MEAIENEEGGEVNLKMAAGKDGGGRGWQWCVGVGDGR